MPISCLENMNFQNAVAIFDYRSKFMLLFGYALFHTKYFLFAAYNKNRYTGLTVQSTTGAYKVDYSQSHSYPDNKPVYNRYHTHSYTEPYYNRRSRVARTRRSASEDPPFPWYKVIELARSLHWIN